MNTVKRFEKALIIDDDHDLSMLLKAILSASIPSVVCASTLQSGMDMLTKVDPDVIFLDNNLPDGQGINHIGSIKSVVPHSVIIMITAVGGNSGKKALEYGADIFLEKPLTSANIREALSSALMPKDPQV